MRALDTYFSMFLVSLQVERVSAQCYGPKRSTTSMLRMGADT
jgi:hypothetical protein